MDEAFYRMKVKTLRGTVAALHKLADSENSTKSVAVQLKPYTVFDGEFTEEGFEKYQTNLFGFLSEKLEWTVVADMPPAMLNVVGMIKIMTTQRLADTQVSREAADNLFKIFRENQDVLVSHVTNERVGALTNAMAVLTDEHAERRLAIAKAIMVLSSQSDELHSLLLSAKTLDEAFKTFNEHVALLRSEYNARQQDSVTEPKG